MLNNNSHTKNITVDIINNEIESLNKIRDNIINQSNNDFVYQINKICKHIIQSSMQGKRVILSGMGKCSFVAGRIAASLSSTGISSFFIDPAASAHGDLGMINCGDILIILSNSGNTQELMPIISYVNDINNVEDAQKMIKIIAITMNESSILARNSDFLLKLPEHKESSKVGSPSSSITMMEVIGNILLVNLQEKISFTREEFLKYHPGGSIGSILKGKKN
ncbi:MAG TPA: SIS domain-containing protein [Candidatus Megaira endosymbiont of Hartmannula sinica]|nr:SIS domain-containing protein [Candidatus Megaera endosymbiont of Hartmannula sinica]